MTIEHRVGPSNASWMRDSGGCIPADVWPGTGRLR